MAKITVAGNALVITSKYSREEIKNVEKHAPQALTLLDEKKTPYFKLSQNGDGKVNKYGVSLNKTSNNGKACTTIIIDQNEALTRDWVAEEYSVLVNNMKKVEDQIEEAMLAVREQIETARTSIEVIE